MTGLGHFAYRFADVSGTYRRVGDLHWHLDSQLGVFNGHGVVVAIGIMRAP